MHVTDEQAAAELRAAGYEPLEPYPGSANSPWPARCTTCGRERTARLNHIRRGTRCKHTDIPGNASRLTPEDAETELRAAGYEPINPYPGAVTVPWRATCTVCGVERKPSLNYIRSGHRCAHSRRKYIDRGSLPRPALPEDEVIDGYRSGKSLAQLADDYNVSITAIRNVMDKRNEPRRRPPKGRPPALNSEQIAMVRERRAHGDSERKIAEAFGVSRGVIARALKQ